jgi:hypothetical protein
MKKYFLIIFIFSVLFPFASFAAELTAGRDIYIGAEQSFGENVYIGAGKVNILGDVNSDLVIIGGETKINNTVSGDLLVLGGRVSFDGKVTGDVRIIGGDVKIRGEIDGDLFVVGGNVHLYEEAILNGDTILVGGDVGIQNDLNNEVKVIAANVKVNSTIAGLLEVTTQYLHLGGSNIEGQLQYYSPQEYSSDDAEVNISGTVSYNEINDLKDNSFVKKTIISFGSFWFVLQFITTIIIAFISIYVFRVFSFGVSHIAVHSFWKSLLVGILALIITPLMIIFLITSLVALPVGLLLLLALIFFSIISVALAGIFIGAWARKTLSKKRDFVVSFQSATVGIIFLSALQFIPYIGNVIRAVLIVVALGATLRYIHKVVLKRV